MKLIHYDSLANGTQLIYLGSETFGSYKESVFYEEINTAYYMKKLEEGWKLMKNLNILQLSWSFPKIRNSAVFIPNDHFHFSWLYSDKFVVNKI